MVSNDFGPRALGGHASSEEINRRILIVDDNHAIHADFQRVLAPRQIGESLHELESSLFGDAQRDESPVHPFEIDSAYQGQEALALVNAALAEGRPYALAFVDMRMPPGWDGLETISRVWMVDPLLQIVICSAYADHSWEEITDRLKPSDGLLILKKPFDAMEAIQLAYTLTRKWTLHREALRHMQSLEGRNAQLETTIRERTNELVRAHEKAAEAERMRLESELRIATHIQTSLLPATMAVRGLEIAATMVPATEIGGDYYDVISTSDGAWIGIGDVAGHGLTSGLVMLMVQSVVSSLATANPTLGPRDAVCALNRVIYDNVRNRLRLDHHVTFTLLRYTHDGALVFAGAHEYIVVVRAATGAVELLDTPGTWIGGMADVSRATVESHCQLQRGDLVVLYSDGVTEARNAQRQQFGLERLMAVTTAQRESTPAIVRDALLAAVREFAAEQIDDITILVMRYLGNDQEQVRSKDLTR